MKLCRVTGNVVATVKHGQLRGHKLLVVQPVDDQGADVGTSFIAVDVAQAGPGDTVLVLQEGNGVRQILRQGKVVPVRSLIVGVVDAVEAAG